MNNKFLPPTQPVDDLRSKYLKFLPGNNSLLQPSSNLTGRLDLMSMKSQLSPLGSPLQNLLPNSSLNPDLRTLKQNLLLGGAGRPNLLSPGSLLGSSTNLLSPGGYLGSNLNSLQNRLSLGSSPLLGSSSLLRPTPTLGSSLLSSQNKLDIPSKYLGNNLSNLRSSSLLNIEKPSLLSSIPSKYLPNNNNTIEALRNKYIKDDNQKPASPRKDNNAKPLVRPQKLTNHVSISEVGKKDAKTASNAKQEPTKSSKDSRKQPPKGKSKVERSKEVTKSDGNKNNIENEQQEEEPATTYECG